MADRPVFLPFAVFAPDRPIFESGTLRKARNLLPKDGTWRPIRRPLMLRAFNSTYRPVRAFCHVWEATIPKQDMIPDAVLAAGTWSRGRDRSTTAADLVEAVGKAELDDSRNVVSTAAPTNDIVQFSLSNPTEAPDATDHVVYYRYRTYGPSGTFTLVVRLKEGAVVITSETVSDTVADEGWKPGSIDLTAPEIAAITDINALSVEFDATRAGTAQAGLPVQDIKIGGWRDEGGNSTNLFDSVDETDDATWIASALLLKDDVDAYRALLTTTLKLPGGSWGDLTLNLRGKTTNVFTLTARLYSGSVLVKESALFEGAYVSAFTALPLTLTDPADPPDFDEIDFANLHLEIEAGYRDTTTEAWGTFFPDADVAAAGLTVTAGVAAKLADDDDGTNVTTDGIADAPYFVVDLGETPDVEVDTDQEAKIVVRAKNLDGSNARSFTVEVHENEAVVATKTISMSAGGTWVNKTWDISGETGITDWTTMRVKVKLSGATAYQMQFSRLRLMLRAVTQVILSEVSLDLPSASFIGVSLGKLSVPGATSGSTVASLDRRELIVGTERELYHVEPDDGWAATQLGGTYTASPKAWDFCSWGELLIATNYIDAIQKWDASTGGAPAALISAGDSPKARFCAVGRDQLFLADINYASPVGYPDEVWWSDEDDAASFTPSTDTGAGRQRLRQVRGQITGLVGGEVVLVFKRSGILMGSYIGPPFWWRWDTLSDSIGTDQPWSIVKVGQSVYFKATQGGFYRVTPGSSPVEISAGVSRYFFDILYSSAAVAQIRASYPGEIDNRLFGEVDPDTGVIIWFYRSPTSSSSSGDPFQNRLAAFYDPRDGRFGHADLTDAFTASLTFLEDGTEAPYTFPVPEAARMSSLAALAAMPNISNDGTFQLKGLALVGWNSTDSQVKLGIFADDSVLPVEVETNTEILDQKTGKRVQIKAVRPIFRTEAWLNASLPTAHGQSIRITVTTSDDQHGERETQEETVLASFASRSGFVPLALTGRFAKAKVEWRGMWHHTMHELLGIEAIIDDEK